MAEHHPASPLSSPAAPRGCAGTGRAAAVCQAAFLVGFFFFFFSPSLNCRLRQALFFKGERILFAIPPPQVIRIAARAAAGPICINSLATAGAALHNAPLCTPRPRLIGLTGWNLLNWVNAEAGQEDGTVPLAMAVGPSRPMQGPPGLGKPVGSGTEGGSSRRDSGCQCGATAALQSSAATSPGSIPASAWPPCRGHVPAAAARIPEVERISAGRAAPAPRR